MKQIKPGESIGKCVWVHPRTQLILIMPGITTRKQFRDEYGHLDDLYGYYQPPAYLTRADLDENPWGPWGPYPENYLA